MKEKPALRADEAYKTTPRRPRKVVEELAPTANRLRFRDVSLGGHSLPMKLAQKAAEATIPPSMAGTPKAINSTPPRLQDGQKTSTSRDSSSLRDPALTPTDRQTDRRPHRDRDRQTGQEHWTHTHGVSQWLVLSVLVGGVSR